MLKVMTHPSMADSDSVLEGILMVIYPPTLLAGPPLIGQEFCGVVWRKDKIKLVKEKLNNNYYTTYNLVWGLRKEKKTLLFTFYRSGGGRGGP